LFNLQVLGESTKKLPEQALAAMPEASGSSPTWMRNLITYRYFALDAEIIWEAVTMHVPNLLAQARTLRASGPDSGDQH
jgi:uncharacterized protein with HEPN domain